MPPGTQPLTREELFAERERLRLEAQRNMAADLIAARLANSGVQPIFAEPQFDRYDAGEHKGRRTALEAAQRYASTFGDRLLEGRSMAFLGGSGCGKSMLASSIVQTINASGRHTAAYATVAMVLREIRATFERGAPLSEGDVLYRYSQPDLLVLDEVGRHSVKPADLQRLFEIVDFRAGRRLPMIVCSNLDEAQVETLIGPAVWERLMGRNGFILKFDWSSYRRAVARGSTGNV